MRTKIAALLVAGAIAGVLSQSAKAIPVDVAGVNAAATEASTVQKAHYWHHHRHYYVKCYYELVVGPYVCRHYRYW